MKANLALNLFVDKRSLCAMSPWVQSAAWFSIGVFLLSCSAVRVWEKCRFQSQTDWHIRIGVASLRHTLHVSRVISFHRLLNCTGELGTQYVCSCLGEKNRSVPLQTSFSQVVISDFPGSVTDGTVLKRIRKQFDAHRYPPSPYAWIERGREKSSVSSVSPKLSLARLFRSPVK